MHCLWIAKCHGCPNAVWITTPDDSIKTAIRGWNRYANGEWRKWDVGPLHRLEYEGWQVNSTDPNDSLCPECAKTRKETK